VFVRISQPFTYPRVRLATKYSVVAVLLVERELFETDHFMLLKVPKCCSVCSSGMGEVEGRGPVVYFLPKRCRAHTFAHPNGSLYT
jgi:hypothetical protein